MVTFVEIITEYCYNTIVAIDEQGIHIVDRRKPERKSFRIQAEYEYFDRLIPFTEIMRIIVRRETTGERIKNLLSAIVIGIVACIIVAGAFYAGFLIISTLLMFAPIGAVLYAFSMFNRPDLHMEAMVMGKTYGVIIPQKKWEEINTDLLQIIRGAGIPAEVMVRE